MHVNMIPPAPKKKRHAALVGLLVILLLAAGICFRLFFPGPLTLADARVMDRTLQLSFEVPGIVGSVPVEKGQEVASGRPLAILNTQGYNAALKEAEAQLAALEALLPAGHTARNVAAPSTTEENLNRLLAEESQARQELTAASEAHAQAAVNKTRRQTLYHNKKLSRKDYEASLESYDAHEKALAQSRVRMERASNARAAAEKELARIRQVQQASGVDAVPAEARVKAYEAQLANVELAAANLAAASLNAPADGTVLDVLVTPGRPVEAGQIAVLFRMSSLKTLMVTGEMDADKALDVRIGQPCEVAIPSFDGKVHAGQITAMLPAEGKKVQVRVLVDTGDTDAVKPAEPGAAAKVTLLD